MPDFLYVFGCETLRQRQNNSLFGRNDEDAHCVLISAADADAALAWGGRIAQRYVSELHGEPEVDWAAAGYASGLEAPSDFVTIEWPRVTVGQYPDFSDWLRRDRM
jgi:hypothetical protein